MGEKIRVLLADDHPLVRAGIRTILSGEPDLELVGEAADGDEARRLTLEIGPDVLVLDLSMPGPTAHDTVLYLRKHCPLTRVLILTAYDDEAYVRALVAAGVAGYVLKDEMPETIVRALRTVWKGDTWLSGALVQKLVRPGEASIVEAPRFSRREVQILRLVLAGKTDRDIGRELGLAERTVRYALRSVYDKLGVDSRVEAAVRAAQLGLGEADL
jgi:DNA-binding NarL/FixJ family response regulator